MSQENEWKKEAPWDELATARLQKLEQQRKLLEMKQRRKRREPLMVQANHDALGLPKAQRWRKERPLGDTGLGGPSLQEQGAPQANVHSPALSNMATVNCSGDGPGRQMIAGSPTEESSEEVEKESHPVRGEREQLSPESNPDVDDNQERDGDNGPNKGPRPTRYPTPGPQLIKDMEAYVMQPVFRGQTLKCRICRDNHGVDKAMFPIYYLFLEDSDTRRQFLMAGRKRKGSRTSNYLISLDPIDLSRNGDNFVGKVRANALGTKFTIFDKGVNPQRIFCTASDQIRRELGAVCYETNVLGTRGPRKMTVIIPAIDEQGQRVSLQPQNVGDSLLSLFQRGARQELLHMRNKSPLWSSESSAYELNFHGRVTQASVKNFQILYPEKTEELVLQFGRVGPNSFTMDFAFPFCPLQAFAICLSNFDKKLACE
ncbi:LOW QUALITY PROTEIN: tubby-related protein 2-like [Suncus etruscus]|uniref:LOW QUALITY PROTEIN: tubby-related protein 2-like n=1 Tax=Suncus etruscus TaxID=109475 RepID=UPI00210F8A51|nr:LOW QUALITY PROTEIN: tubby-related protein 2-like [Suncus etruscus]